MKLTGIKELKRTLLIIVIAALLIVYFIAK